MPGPSGRDRVTGRRRPGTELPSRPREASVPRTDGRKVASFAKELGPEPSRCRSERRERTPSRESRPTWRREGARERRVPGPSEKDRATERRKPGLELRSRPRHARVPRLDGPRLASFANELGPEPRRRGSERREPTPSGESRRAEVRDLASERRVPGPELPSSPSELRESTTLRKEPGPSGKDRVAERRKAASEPTSSTSIAEESGRERTMRGRVRYWTTHR